MGVVFNQPRSDEERMMRTEAFVTEMDIEGMTCFGPRARLWVEARRIGVA